MLAGRGRRRPKGRALFVFRQDSGIIAWRSDLQVLSEARLALAARSVSWFPWKRPDSMWQAWFAATGVIAHSCHSWLFYLFQSALTLAARPPGSCSSSPLRVDLWLRWDRAEDAAGPVLALPLPGCWGSLPGQLQDALQGATFCKKPQPAWPQRLAGFLVGAGALG